MTASYRFEHSEREKYLSHDKFSLTVSVRGKILLKKSPKPSGSQKCSYTGLKKFMCVGNVYEKTLTRLGNSPTLPQKFCPLSLD